MVRLRSFLIAILASSSLTLFACGGRVGLESGNHDGGPAPECPQPGAIAQGGACTSAGQSCAGPTTETCCGPDTTQCTCEGGRWSCVSTGPSCECPPACPQPANLTSGAPCTVVGQTCPALLPNCIGEATIPATCTCSGNGVGFLCTAGDGPDCGVVEEPPPPSCPPQDQTFANEICSSPQLQCGGDPTECDGSIFYDALQCSWDGSAWRWSVLAQTICGDGGPPIGDVFVPNDWWGPE